MDEATSAIDIQTEQLIQEAMTNCFKECTVLTIAHRINTIINYDMILSLKDGKIVEYDTPKNLLQDQNSLFWGLWDEYTKNNE